MSCDYFSCRARFGVFIGLVCVPLRLLAQGDHKGCGSRASVFLGAQKGALSLLEHVGRKDCGSCSSGVMGQDALFSVGVGVVCGGNGGDEGRQDTQGGSG